LGKLLRQFSALRRRERARGRRCTHHKPMWAKSVSKGVVTYRYNQAVVEETTLLFSY